MSERAFELEPYGVAFDCETCGEEMKPEKGAALMSYPVQYPHGCPNGHTKNLPERYPLVRYRLKGTAP